MRFLLAALCLLSTLSARAEVVDVDNAEFARLAATGLPVVDIRTEPEWKETGIVAGSRLLTFFDERGRADPGAWLEKVAAIAPKKAPIILICRTGNRTGAVARFLSEKVGYGKVYNVKQGIYGWMKEHRPVTPATMAIAACKADKNC